MDYNKLGLFFNTIRFLKPKQVFFQIWYRVKVVWPFQFSYNNSFEKFPPLRWNDVIFNLRTFKGDNTFEFLNIVKQFKSSIDWGFKKHKKLWTYNLNYFDYLNQQKIDKDDGLQLIKIFISNYNNIKDGKESYPTSLRLINWIKFVSKHKIEDISIFQTMREDANRLYSNMEYHLLANHLLENVFALWFSAHFFKDHRYLKKATYLLKRELNEQILKDGAHFELSPMYHQLMLYRILDCINLAELNSFANIETTSYLRLIAAKMISWLNQITFESGAVPLFNDAANNINPDSDNLMYYAKELNISINKIELSESGFRKFKGKNHEIVIDVANITPSYTPGHSHADTFNFELYVNNKPIIVDTGTSTYNICPEREYQRSTKAHNTVSINDENSSQVWSGFRVAKRANVTMNIDKYNYLSATHNGYRNFNVLHNRLWQNKKDEIKIKDILIGQKVIGKLFLHFHPDINLKENNNCFLINENIEISFSDYKKIKVLNSTYSPEFNLTITKKTLEVTFETKITTTIKIN